MTSFIFSTQLTRGTIFHCLNVSFVIEDERREILIADNNLQKLSVKCAKKVRSGTCVFNGEFEGKRIGERDRHTVVSNI